MKAMIDIQNVSKRYNDKLALDKVSLTIKQGTCYGLLGPNGAGKSTLMKILAGIVLDFDGDIQIDGMSIRTDRKRIHHYIGYVPQEISLEPKLSALDNLRFFGRMHGLHGNELQNRIQEVLDMVGLSNRQKDAIKTYSGGMKRRINIGCAILHRPKILIMDEPTVGVDPQSRNYIFNIIRSLQADGTTILYSSHYMEEVQLLCDAMALVDQGRVIESGTLREIRAKHSTPSIYIEADSLAQNTLQPFGSVKPRGNGYVIETEQVLAAIHQLSAALQQDAVDVERLEITSSSLEDIFLQLTGSSLRDND